ncbi:MAG: Ig-like domain-containing protein, partial [Caldilineaceae bacterium]|nr:Ig-like domain-containing protein [Caldilineaceae bacterium]
MAVGLAFFVLATCGRDSPTQSTHPTQRPAQPQPYTTTQPSRINISPSSVILNSVGQTTQLTAVVLDQNGLSVSGTVVTWSSSKEDVATVGGQGLVKAVGNGSASIIATSGSVSDTALVTVLVPRTDRDVLVAFYENAAGEQWTIKSNWVSIHHLRYWHGVTVNAEGRVTEINLPNNNLRGPLTSDLGFLEELETLRLNDNQLTDHLSPELGRLAKLRHLDLSRNQLSGAIPAELGELHALEEMDLSFNRLSGSIPRELAGLTELTRLSISVNELDGSIPSELGRLGQLTSLRLDHNRLSGPIPRHLAGMKQLRLMVLADNRLTGEIPVHLSLMDDLTELALDHNRLEGSIPSQLGLLTDLQRLGLAGNLLSGGVPSSLEKLSELTHLHLFSNPGLAGILPRSLTTLKLEELLLEGTQLCVPRDDDYENWLEQIPVKTVTHCTNLESNVLTSLYNATNGLNWEDNTNWLGQEPVDTWYGVSTDSKGHVTDIDLANNNLSGSVPRQLAGLSKLKTLNLSTNGFLSGPLPRELINLDLRTLQLDGTRMCAPEDGEFQAWLQTIPVRNVSSCEDLDLNTLKALFALFNSTNGPEWNDRTNWNSDEPLDEWYGVTIDGDGRITELNLAGNNLIGTLPADLSVLSYLNKLDVSDNEGLTGPLPNQWTELDLEYLWMEGTQLCAPPDAGFQAWLDEIPEYSISDCADTRPEWYVLVSLYNSTKGKDWTNSGNWLSEAPLDQWYGVTTDEEGRVTALDLNENGLIGELPPGLGELSRLVSLNLSGNRLSGTIPSELGQLTALT